MNAYLSLICSHNIILLFIPKLTTPQHLVKPHLGYIKGILLTNSTKSPKEIGYSTLRLNQFYLAS